MSVWKIPPSHPGVAKDIADEVWGGRHEKSKKKRGENLKENSRKNKKLKGVARLTKVQQARVRIWLLTAYGKLSVSRWVAT
jgi:hypothetical protein